MKYIITEEQSKEINQNKFDLGPLGSYIRKIIDIYNYTFIEKYVVVYLGEKYDNYMVIMWSNKGEVSREVEEKITRELKQFIPVDITVTITSY